MDVFQVANYKDYLFDTAKTIFGIDSPTGYYHAVIKKVEEIATGLGYQFEQIEKGCGAASSPSRVRTTAEPL